MKYNIIFFFFLTSCLNNSYVVKNKTYSAKGFAKIDRQFLLNSDENSFVSHNRFKLGTKIRLINPVNGKSLEKLVKKKVKYDNFYKTRSVFFPSNFIKVVSCRSKRIICFF